MKKYLIIFSVGFLGLFACLSLGATAFAEDDPGVSGCNGVAVDPAASLEDQQSVCGTAEQFPSTSCASGGHGTCSSPKTNDIMVEGNHCICLEAEVTEPSPT